MRSGSLGSSFDERGNPTDLTYWPWGPMKKLGTVTTHRSTDGGGTEDQVTRFYYDLMGRSQNTYFPDDSHEYTVYEFGQLKSWKTRKDQTKTISYDARGREYAHTWDDGMTSGISRAWDDANRLLSMSNNISTLDYQYDSAGQVLVEGSTVRGSGGQTPAGSDVRKQVSYCRYPSGDVSRVIYPNGSPMVDRFYTARGQLKSVGWGSGATSYVYWPDGKVNYQAFTGTGGVTTTYGYNERGMIKSVSHNNGGGHSLAYREYWRDERDRILAWKRGPSGGPNGMEDERGDRYEYDEEGQLKKASYRAATPEETPSGALRADEFQYDALGNRAGTNRVASRGVMNFERKNNKLNQYRGWWPYSITNYDEDLGGWGEPGEANGVMMQDGWITASFNALNQPMGMWSPMYPNGASAQWMWFGYDPLGRCVKRWVSPLVNGHAPPPSTNPATYFYYDGWNLVQEGSSGNATDRVYVHGGRVDEIVASWAGSEWRHHHYDARGHCIMLTDTNGLIREQYDYDAFGLPYFYNANGDRLGGANRWGNRFLFTGREWLQDLKVYDFRNRMYQPELGRFLQPDPKEFEAGDYNLYRYCHNDPVNKSDPTGLRTEIVAEVQQLKTVTGTNIPQWVTTAKLTGTFSGSSWKEAGRAAATVALAAAHTTGHEHFGIVVHSPSNPSSYYATKPIQGFYEFVPRRGGWYNTSDFSRLRVPGFNKVAGYWGLAQSERDWPPGDRQALWKLGLNGVLGVPAPNSMGHPDFRYYPYDPNNKPPPDS